MSVTLYFYLKFCEKREYARDFVAGRLWMNPLSYFKQREGSSEDGRTDRFEGSSGWYQPSELSPLQFGDIRIDASELAGPVILQPDFCNTVNILCLYAGTSLGFESISTDNIEALGEHLRIPEICMSMGNVAVMVHNVSAFNKRVMDALNKPHKMQAGLVTYFDPVRFSGEHRYPIFAKRQEFSWQREYRFAIDRMASESEPYILDVGSLEDVCKIIDPSTFNDLFKVALPNDQPSHHRRA